MAATCHSYTPIILDRMGLPTPAAFESLSPLAAAFLPQASLTIREYTGDNTVSACDPELAITQRSLASAPLAAAAKLVMEATVGDLPFAASVRSAGGPGAGSWMLAPARPCHRMLDAQLAIALRVRLGMAMPMMTGTCRHRRPNGECCGKQLDPKGVHARSCPVGGWLVRRHNAGVNVLAEWAERCGCKVFKEQVVPTAAAAADEGHEARLDLVVFSPLVAGPAYVDFVVPSALSRESLAKGSALKDGMAAALAASKKCRKYPGCAVYPFPVEGRGRIGDAAATFVRLIAPWAPAERSKSIAELYHDLASVLQRASAEAVVAAGVRT